jgi:hypothetical protein
MKSNLIFFVIFITAVFGGISSCQSPTKPVADPAGWKVVAFECIVQRANTHEQLHVDENRFEHLQETQVRGQKMRIILKGTPDQMSTQVTWIFPSGQERQDPPISMNKTKAHRVFQDYRNKYFISIKFPTESSIKSIIISRYGEIKDSLSLCNRKAFRFIRGNQIVVVDARTGLQLARYRIINANNQDLIEQLVYARWELRRGREKGYYEIRCGP